MKIKPESEISCHIAASLTWLGKLHNRKVALKSQKTGKLGLLLYLPGYQRVMSLSRAIQCEVTPCDNMTYFMGHLHK